MGSLLYYLWARAVDLWRTRRGVEIESGEVEKWWDYNRETHEMIAKLVKEGKKERKDKSEIMKMVKKLVEERNKESDEMFG